jgi:hypothetical protein
MTELAEIFVELGISQYLGAFIDQGFDTWDTILDITESDFDVLGVKLGHRRKLQRKIANSRGVSADRALISLSRNTPSDDRQPDEHKAGGTGPDPKGVAGGPHGAKRKYRRHPKVDENAPERPPSAYVIFSNKMREDLKGRNLSFTEIAKLVGENWQNLSPSEKEPFEQQAFTAKEKYNNELVEYKKTDSFKGYSQYLIEFKARQSNQQPVTDVDIAKRPKLEARQSTTSSGTASSSTSQHGNDAPTGRMRVESAGSTTSQWFASSGQPSPPAQLPNVPNPSVSHGEAVGQGSPKPPLPTVLPGYREAIFGTHQTLPWREGPAPRDETAPPFQQLPRIANVDERRSSYGGGAVRGKADAPNLTGSQQHARRTGLGHTPPLLTSESTTGSANSSAFFSPHTPLEPTLDRSLPIASLLSQKSSSLYENQLPPLRPPSLSPQSSMPSALQSPNGIHAILDFPNSIHPIRGYSTGTSQLVTLASHDARVRDLMSTSLTEDHNLDPVSALLKAGEIVNRNSQSRPPS